MATRRRTAILLFIVGILAASSCTGPLRQLREGPPTGQAGFLPEAKWAQRIVGPLHTDGTRIVDARRATVLFRGINIHDLRAGSGNPRSVEGGVVTPGWQVPSASEFENIQHWGFNVVRVGISWANIEPTPPSRGAIGALIHRYNAAYLDALDATVRGFADRGIAVILQMAQNEWSPAFVRQGGTRPGVGMPVWLYRGSGITDVTTAKVAFFSNQGQVQEQYAAAWRAVAARFAANPTVVGADLMNEPYAHGAQLSAEGLHLDALYERIGAAIRAVNPTILLMFQDSQDRFNAVWGVTRPPSFDGVVYTFHLYTRTWTPDALRRMEDHWARARGWGIPMTVSEFNAYGYGSNQAYGNDTFDTSWRADTKRFFAYATARDIGFTFSAYAGNNSVFVPSDGAPKPGLLRTIQSSF